MMHNHTVYAAVLLEHQH